MDRENLFNLQRTILIRSCLLLFKERMTRDSGPLDRVIPQLFEPGSQQCNLINNKDSDTALWEVSYISLKKR